jgi:tetratricopeptide (TPR) repeat protein
LRDRYEPYLLRSRRLEQLDRAEEALAALDQALESAADKRDVLEQRGAFHIRQGNIEAAVADLDAAMELWLEQKQFNRRFPQVGQSFLMTATANAEVYRQLAKKHPDFDSLHSTRAWWLHRQGDWDGLKRLMDDSGFMFAALFLPQEMADYHTRFEQWMEGERVKARATLDVEALAYGIWLVVAPGQVDSAENVMKMGQFLRANSAEMYARFVYAMALYRTDQFEAALQELRGIQAVSAEWINPWRYHPNAMFVEAMVQHRLGNVEQATKLFRSAESILKTVQNLPDDQVPVAMTSVPAPGDYWLVAELLYREARETLGQ